MFIQGALKRLQTPFFILTVYVILSSLRDVFCEWFLKGNLQIPKEIFLFCFTFTLFLTGVLGERIFSKPIKLNRQMSRWLIGVNVATVVMYSLAILAIASPVGAATTSFVDFGMTPVFTAIMAMFLLGEQLKRRYVLGLIGALFGIYLFSNMSLELILRANSQYLRGLSYGILSGLIFSLVQPINKKLLNMGLDQWQVLSNRMLFPSLFFLAYAVYQGTWVQLLDHAPKLITYSLIFGSGPILLGLTVLKKIEVKNLVAWMFLIPVFTFLSSAVASYAELNFRTCLGGIIVLTASAYMEGFFHKVFASLPRSLSKAPKPESLA